MIKSFKLNGNSFDFIAIAEVDGYGAYNFEPRIDGLSWTHGGRLVHLDRKEWRIAVMGYVVGNSFTKVVDNTNAFLREVNAKDVHDVEFTLFDGRVLQGRAVVSPLVGSVSASDKTLLPVQIEFTILEPLHGVLQDAVLTDPPELTGLVIPFKIPFSWMVPTGVGEITVTNNGNTWWFAEIFATGVLEGILIENVTTGESLYINDRVTPTSPLHCFVDNLNFKFLIGSRDVLRSVDGGLPRIVVGNNVFRIGAKVVGAGSQVTIKYGDYYYGI